MPRLGRHRHQPTPQSKLTSRLVYPLDTAKTRLQASTSAELAAYEREDEKAARKSGLKAALRRRLRKWQLISMVIRIVKTEGIAGAFKGFSASMINCFSMRECIQLGIGPGQ